MTDICPKCDIDREVVFKMAMEELGSDNWEYAWKILKNCQACKEAYRENLEWLSNNIPQGVRDGAFKLGYPGI